MNRVESVSEISKQEKPSNTSSPATEQKRVSFEKYHSSDEEESKQLYRKFSQKKISFMEIAEESSEESDSEIPEEIDDLTPPEQAKEENYLNPVTTEALTKDFDKLRQAVIQAEKISQRIISGASPPQEAHKSFQDLSLHCNKILSDLNQPFRMVLEKEKKQKNTSSKLSFLHLAELHENLSFSNLEQINKSINELLRLDLENLTDKNNKKIFKCFLSENQMLLLHFLKSADGELEKKQTALHLLIHFREALHDQLEKKDSKLKKEIIRILRGCLQSRFT
ncbi:MAG: hypothetical protein Tsb0015_16970 [Simkaniaceae bacterium]